MYLQEAIDWELHPSEWVMRTQALDVNVPLPRSDVNSKDLAQLL